MKLSNLAALHLIGSTLAFCPQIGGALSRYHKSKRTSYTQAFPAPQANEFDYTSINSAVARAAARAARVAKANEPHAGAAATPQAPNSALDTQSLTQVLTEFVQSDYSRKLCEQCKVQPMIGSANVIGVMFESVRLTDGRLEVRLHRVFEQRSEKLLDRLVKHLRARMPQLERLQFEARSPPSTRTFVI